jgi:hypothetical protein
MEYCLFTEDEDLLHIFESPDFLSSMQIAAEDYKIIIRA